MLLTTEHSRVGALQRELGSTQRFELLTDAKLNDKFVLAQAVSQRRGVLVRGDTPEDERS